MLNFRASTKAIIIYWLALLGLTACPSFYVITSFVVESYAAVDMTLFWLGLPMILASYALISLIVRWLRSIRVQATPYPWIAVQVTLLMVIALVVAAGNWISELRTIPRGIFSSHKDGLLWQTALMIWLEPVMHFFPSIHIVQAKGLREELRFSPSLTHYDG